MKELQGLVGQMVSKWLQAIRSWQKEVPNNTSNTMFSP